MAVIKIIVIILAALFSFACILKFNFIPPFFISIGIVLILFHLAFRIVKLEKLKIVLFNAAFIFLAYALLEIYFSGFLPFSLQEFKKQTHYFTRTPYYKADVIRGYCPPKNCKVRSQELMGSRILYDAIYTTNKYGLRITPHDINGDISQENRPAKDILFFGCSYTFGEGVNGNESIPYLIEEKSNGKYWCYNFGFLGYGPQQMLRLLESGMLDKIIADKKPAIGVYITAPFHIGRAVGKYPYITWDVNGPKYILNTTGKAQYSGRFKDNPLIFLVMCLFQLNKSEVFMHYFAPAIYKQDINMDDARLFVQIIISSKEIFQRKFKGDFYVVAWPAGNEFPKEYAYAIAELKENGIQIITLDSMSMFSNSLEYDNSIIKYDKHPNAACYQKASDL